MEQEAVADNVVAKPRPTCGILSVVSPFVGLLAGVLVFVLYPDKDRGWNIVGAIFFGGIAFLLSTIVGLVLSIAAFVRKERGRALRIIGLVLNGLPIALLIVAIIDENL
jgi:hypothetical protein